MSFIQTGSRWRCQMASFFFWINLVARSRHFLPLWPGFTQENTCHLASPSGTNLNETHQDTFSTIYTTRLYDKCCGQLWVWHMICGQTCDGLYHFAFCLVNFWEIDHIHLSSEAQCVSHLYPQVDCHNKQTEPTCPLEIISQTSDVEIRQIWIC